MLIAVFLITFAISLVFQTDGTVNTRDVVMPILEGGAAATFTGYLVGFFKKAKPHAGDPSIVAVAIASGLTGSALASMINGGIQLSQSAIALVIFQGIAAAALAGGVQQANKPSVDKPTES